MAKQSQRSFGEEVNKREGEKGVLCLSAGR